MKLGWISVRIFPPVMLAAVVVGCGVTEGGKELVHQTKGAGHILRSNPDPAVAAIGGDVEDNSAAVEAEIGVPRNAQPYSHEASAAARNKQQADIAAREAWKDLFNEAMGAVAGAFGLGSVWLWLKNLKLGKVAESVIDGVEEFRDANKGQVSDTLKATITKAALDVGAADALKALVVKHTD